MSKDRSKERKYEITFPITLYVEVDPDKYYNLPLNKEPRLVSEIMMGLSNQIDGLFKEYLQYSSNDDLWKEKYEEDQLKDDFDQGYFETISWDDLNINEVFTSIRKQYNNQKSR